MKIRQRILATVLTLLFGTSVFGQVEDSRFNQVYQLIQQKDFFEAENVYSAHQPSFSVVEGNFIEALLANAFHKPDESNEKIHTLFTNHYNELADSLKLGLLEIRADNSAKRYEYKEAKNAIATILDDYVSLIPEDEVSDYENDLKIWTALENQPKQKIVMSGSNRLKITKDKVGLKNLPVSNGADTLNFLFDTGANFSTVAYSVAKKLNMEIIPTTIEVTSSTGKKVPVQLAVCPKLSLGHIDIYNAVFLVLEDKALSFSHLVFKYKIRGVLGFPIIEALNEVQITKDGYFIVPEEETKFNVKSNMAMDGLTPFISIEDRMYKFDTGANKTMLYTPYYLANQHKIDDKYKLKTIQYGGAGGNVKQKGYIIDIELNLFGKVAKLKNVSLLKEEADERKGLYGVIGQDLIEKFDKMTINFNRMIIKFD
jgi:predicted aspartyl protease